MRATLLEKYDKNFNVGNCPFCNVELFECFDNDEIYNYIDLFDHVLNECCIVIDVGLQLELRLK